MSMYFYISIFNRTQFLFMRVLYVSGYFHVCMYSVHIYCMLVSLLSISPDNRFSNAETVLSTFRHPQQSIIQCLLHNGC